MHTTRVLFPEDEITETRENEKVSSHERLKFSASVTEIQSSFNIRNRLGRMNLFVYQEISCIDCLLQIKDASRTKTFVLARQ